MRALVVGYGRMGRFHARALKDLGFTVVTVDPDPVAGADHSAIPGRRFDAAVVAAPVPSLMGTSMIAAVVADRLLVEKPFAPSLTEARTLRDHLLNRQVCVGFIERFNPRVVELRQRLDWIGVPVTASFIRWNDRPSPDIATDLRIHDVDLARHLGVDHVAAYDTRDGMAAKRREITVTGAQGRATANLMRHSESPLHALWRAFLTDGEYPTPDDAVRAHEALCGYQIAVAA